MRAAATDIVPLVSSRIAERVGPERFQIWFADTTRLRFSGRQLQVGVPNLFVGTWIESHFGPEILSAAREAAGEDVQVTYAIEPALFAKVRKDQLESEAAFLAQEAGRGRAGAPPAADGPPARGPRSRRHGPPDAAAAKTLDNFVVGECSRLAFTAAREVCRRPGKTFNPLFIHGSTGVGKTHLLQGICHGAAANGKPVRACYLTAEQFTNQYILAVRTHSLDAFRQRYRGLDVLIIDDIHFLAAKKGTQEEFLHTFNAIDAAGKQIVMASDAHPKLICQLRQTLVNRFISGLVVRMDPPDLETRCRILEAKALAMGKAVPEDVCRYLAERAPGNVRELEGMLISLLAAASLGRLKIDLALAREVIESRLPDAAMVIRSGDVIDTVSAAFHIGASELRGRKRSRSVALARQVAMYLMRRRTALSAADVGKALGDRSHATVLAACQKIEKLLAENAPLPAGLREGDGPGTLRGLLEKLERAVGL